MIGPMHPRADDRQEPERLLTPGEVARMFRVDPKTVTRWARAGKIFAIKTPGGHRRFKASQITELLQEVDERTDPSA